MVQQPSPFPPTSLLGEKYTAKDSCGHISYSTGLSPSRWEPMHLLLGFVLFLRYRPLATWDGFEDFQTQEQRKSSSFHFCTLIDSSFGERSLTVCKRLYTRSPNFLSGETCEGQHRMLPTTPVGSNYQPAPFTTWNLLKWVFQL